MTVVAISAGLALDMSAIGMAAILGRNRGEARVSTNPVQEVCFKASTSIAAVARVLLICAALFTTTAMQGPAREGLRLESLSALSLRTSS